MVTNETGMPFLSRSDYIMVKKEIDLETSQDDKKKDFSYAKRCKAQVKPLINNKDFLHS